jgi:two-component system response regulator HydG
MLDEKQILAQIPCGILVLDADNIIQYANEWVCMTTGHTFADLNGQPAARVIGEEPDTSNLCNLITADNRQIPVMVTRRTTTAPSFTYLSILAVNEPVTTATDASVPDGMYGLIGRSPAMQEVYGFIGMAAATDSNVVIQGESGTGKELVAAAIHQASNRHKSRFVRVNCAALTETLLESELFGHAKGAFTGAYRDHVGKFEYAAGGTIFLDEIGEISPAMQAKLLRVLQERVVVRVGDNHEIPVDVRVVVATNKNLRSLVSKGRFREDLFYRLNVFPIHLPPLRERGVDTPILVQHFIDKFKSRTGKQILTCSADAMRILIAYCWPGNVRELENAIEHAFVLCRQSEIQVVDLPHELRVAAVREGICAEKIAGIEQVFHPAPVRMQTHSTANRVTLSPEALLAELERCGGNKAELARVLGISKVGLWKKMKKMGIG